MYVVTQVQTRIAHVSYYVYIGGIPKSYLFGCLLHTSLNSAFYIHVYVTLSNDLKTLNSAFISLVIPLLQELLGTGENQ